MNVCFLATPKDVSSTAPTYACHGFTLGVSASQVDKLCPDHIYLDPLLVAARVTTGEADLCANNTILD